MLWVGGPLGTLERLSLASFVRQGHPLRLHTYDDVGAVPAGVQRVDGRAVLPESEIARCRSADGRGSWSAFSNRFRYALLAEQGGPWCDTDVVLTRPLHFSPGLAQWVASEWAAHGQPGQPSAPQAASCAMKSAAGSPLMRACLAAAMAVDPLAAGWGATGVSVLRTQLAALGLNTLMLRPAIFCPVPPWEILTKLFGDLSGALNGDAHAVHCYNEILRRNFIDKDGAYPPHSLYQRLKRHYLGAADTVG